MAIFFLQQLINRIMLGAIYDLIAIGYTMVFGIIGMVNFAHGDVFVLATFIALIIFLVLTQMMSITSLALSFVVVLFSAMALPSLWSYMIERLARSPPPGIVPPGAADLGNRNVGLFVEFRLCRARPPQQILASFSSMTSSG